MEALQNKFWKSIRRLSSSDRSVEVPSKTVSKALDIFQPGANQGSKTLFRLRPMAATGLRKAGPSSKYLYELDNGFVVQLEVSEDGEGIHLQGVAHGFDDATVLLYAKEYVNQTEIVEGCFEFGSITPGRINLCFSYEGEDYWITGLKLEEQNEA